MMTSEVLALSLQSFGITCSDNRFGLKVHERTAWLDVQKPIGEQVKDVMRKGRII
jgi:hypothetical protein